jgi:hypothetical protein
MSTLPRKGRVVAVGKGRSRGIAVAVALILLLLVAFSAAPLRAAEDDPYAVTVPVDASGDTIGKARDQARNDGQRRALATLAERLSGGSGGPAVAAKLPKVDDKTVTDLIASFEVANERMSPTRYVADVTYHFRPADVQRVLQKAGIALGSPGATGPGGIGQAGTGPGGTGPGGIGPAASPDLGRSLVVVPVYQSGAASVLWDDPNPWREAWAQAPPGTGPAAPRFAVPLGDAGDLAAIDAAKARGADPTALAAIARRNGAEEAIVALATLRGTPSNPAGLDIAVRRYRAGQPVDAHADMVTANPGERPEQLFRRAAAQIAADIESGWKKGPLPRYDQQGRLTAVLPITGLEDWLRVRDRLAALSAIRNVSLVALSLQEATIEIEYLGSVDQLKANLAEAKLDLVRTDPQGVSAPGMSTPGMSTPGMSAQGAQVALPSGASWRLARTGAPAQ